MKTKRNDELEVTRCIISICAHCRRVRDEDGCWRFLETSVAARTDADFSHGICSTCGPQFYPGLYEEAVVDD
jgi:hypothetical protein